MVTTRYYFNKLNDKEKAVYKSVYDAIMNYQDSIEIEDLPENAIKWILSCIIWDNPYITCYEEEKFNDIWNENKRTINLSLQKRSELEKERRKKIEDIVTTILSLDGLAQMEEFQKEVFVHDFICNNIEIVERNASLKDSNNIFGAFVKKRASVEGIVKAVKLLLNILDVKCIVVAGKYKDRNHYWNIVKVDDWEYNLDVTNDLIERKNNGGHMRYDYFNFRSADIPTYLPIDKDVLPECVAIYNNYLVRAGGFVSNKERLDKYIQNTLGKKRKTLYFKVNRNVEDSFTNINLECFSNAILSSLKTVAHIMNLKIKCVLESNPETEIISVDIQYL